VGGSIAKAREGGRGAIDSGGGAGSLAGRRRFVGRECVGLKALSGVISWPDRVAQGCGRMLSRL
jgi:hypothetical protein